MSWTSPASTRSLALIRIGFATLIWGTWGKPLVFNLGLLPEELASSALLLSTSTMMLIGWRSRLACALTGLAMPYLLFVRELETGPVWPELQLALVILAPLVLAFGPCGRSYSLDRWLAQRRALEGGSDQPEPVERGDVRALGVLATLAIGAQVLQALAMSHPRWLSGYTLERVLLWQSQGSVSPGLAMSQLIAWLPALSVLGCLLWWALAAAMSWPRTRGRAVAVAMAAQLFIYLLIPAGTAPLAVALLYLALLDPERVHAVIDELG